MDNVFTRAKALLQQHGWAKGASEIDGRLCLGEALQRAGVDFNSRSRRQPFVRAVFDAIKVHQPSGLRMIAVPVVAFHVPADDSAPITKEVTYEQQPLSIPQWNDYFDTTLDDVYAVLDIAAKQWEADKEAEHA